MNTRLLLVFSAFFLTLPALASAQNSGLDAAKKKFAGTYVSKKGVKRERNEINGAIESLVDDMTFYKRPFARSALKDSTKPCPTLIVFFKADQMAINCKGRVDAQTPADGTPVKWQNDDGDDFRLSQKIEKNRMVQVFRGEDGNRKNVYTLRDGGKELFIRVTITSDDLPRPLKYTRLLRRK